MSQSSPKPSPKPSPQPSPKPSPVGPSSVLTDPPPVKKRVVRRLHELQDPASPVKPFKLCRTESNLEPPPINLGESVLSVPVDLHGMSFICDLELDAIILEKIDVNEELASQDLDPKGKQPADKDNSSTPKTNDKQPADKDNSSTPKTNDKQPADKDKQPADKDPEDEAGPSSTPKTSDKPAIDARKCPLLLSSRPKSKKDKSGDLPFLLATPVA